MQIEAITLREIRLPLVTPFRTASGSIHTRRILLLELSPGSGPPAWSECVAGEQPSYSPETIDTAWFALREWLAPRVLGVTFEEPSAVHSALQVGLRGHPMAKAAIEMGMWALVAQIRGVSLARLLGGTREKIATGVAIGIQDSPEALVATASNALAAGYRRLKMKIRPGADVAYVSAVRRELGPDAPLAADANSAYTLEHAEHLTHLDELDLMMLEQPLGADDLVRHAQLQRRLRTPICLDESITTLESAEDMLSLGSGRIINVKPGRVGGLAVARAIHDLCERNGIPVWCGGMLESGIGRAYNVALASLPNFTIPGDISPSARYFKRDIVAPVWTMDTEGRVEVPRDRPGLGIEIDLERVEALTVRSETLVR